MGLAEDCRDLREGCVTHRELIERDENWENEDRENDDEIDTSTT